MCACGCFFTTIIFLGMVIAISVLIELGFFKKTLDDYVRKVRVLPMRVVSIVSPYFRKQHWSLVMKSTNSGLALLFQCTKIFTFLILLIQLSLLVEINQSLMS